MQGELRGDITRDSFDPTTHFSRVLLQQGRVSLDADWNEQTDIVLHFLRTLAKDLIGGHGGPGVGFSIGLDAELPDDVVILDGHYYVDGFLCENERTDLTYTRQPGYPFQDSVKFDKGGVYMVYLDAWERHVSTLENDTIHEVALGGPDTATREQVVWQVKVTNKKPDGNPITGAVNPNSAASLLKNFPWPQWTAQWQNPSRGAMKAQGKTAPADQNEPCIIPPASNFRGAENQLYRIEVHAGGLANKASFKWSRDNGSVAYPIGALTGNSATLTAWPKDDDRTPITGDWLELVDDRIVMGGYDRMLVKVKGVSKDDMMVMFDPPPGVTLPAYTTEDFDTKHILLRRWDHGRQPAMGTGASPRPAGDGGLLIEEGKWLDIEDGIQIWFEPGGSNQNQRYRKADFWIVPARTETGDVVWEQNNGQAKALPPHGIEHHYAPLAVVGDPTTGAMSMASLRLQIRPLAVP